MKISNIVLVLFVLLSFSCKNNNEKQIVSIDKKEVIPQKQLIINFNFKTNKADTFMIMLNNIEVDELQKKNIHIFEDVVSSMAEDAIIAEFGNNNISNNIIIHLGNKTLKEVEVKSIFIAYGENQFSITSAEDLNKYFAFNKFIERDSTNKILKTKKVEGKHNPAFRLKRNLINILKKD
jgi:cupin superfamily acireductone dioxygenase involved in methionine salvage